jgi:transcriptional regulator with XRE-family HTH domain
VASLRIYKTYSFRDKDPCIDQLRTPAKAVKYSEIAAKSGVSEGTLRNWFHGTTRRPQHASVMAVARALGYDYKLVKRGA